MRGVNYVWDGGTSMWRDKATGLPMGDAHGDGGIPPWEITRRIDGYLVDDFGAWQRTTTCRLCDDTGAGTFVRRLDGFSDWSERP